MMDHSLPARECSPEPRFRAILELLDDKHNGRPDFAVFASQLVRLGNLLSGKSPTKPPSRLFCFLYISSTLCISVEAFPIVKKNMTESSETPVKAGKETADSRIAQIQVLGTVETETVNLVEPSEINFNARSDLSSVAGESPNVDGDNGVGSGGMQGIGTVPVDIPPSNNGPGVNPSATDTSGHPLSTRLTQAPIAVTSGSYSTSGPTTILPTEVLTVTPTAVSTEATPLGGIRVDGKINASFELIIPSRSALFPQETAPSSPSIDPSLLPTLLNVYAEAGSNIYNNYSTCEPDDDGPMLRLLSGLLAALLLLYLINTIKPWYRLKAIKAWFKDWKMSLPGMPPPSKNTDILENAVTSSRLPEARHEDSDTPRCSCSCTRTRSNGSGTDAHSKLQSLTAPSTPCLESLYPMTNIHAATITPISPFSSSSMLPTALMSPATRGRNLTKDFSSANSRSSSGLRTVVSQPTMTSSHNMAHLPPGNPTPTNNDATRAKMMTRLSPPSYIESGRLDA